MPRLLHLILLCLFFLPACTAAPTPTATQTVPPTATVTQMEPSTTPSPDVLQTRAAAFDQTATVRALTPSLTTTSSSTPRPTYTITATPTITPTFDPHSQPSYTPAAAAVCPQFASGTAPTPDFIHDGVFTVPEDGLIGYLNQYGPQPLANFLKTFTNNPQTDILISTDLTHDGVPDLIFQYAWSFYIFGCQDGRYQTTFKIKPDGVMMPKIWDIIDANRNGIPEIILLVDRGTQGGGAFWLLEWDGNTYQDVIENSLLPDDQRIPYQKFDVNSNGAVGTEDYNKDGLLEYRIDVSKAIWSIYQFGIPWRDEVQYFRWNGKKFTFEESIFSPPEFRFQAVQDGDRALAKGRYDQALEFYQQTVFSDQLQWWTPERANQLLDAYWAVNGPYPSPTPTLSAPDPAEYDHLAAYARFKIMILHAARGWAADAQTVYDTLQAKYPEGKPGHIHAQLAQAFWSEYQASGSAAQACQSALAFAREHQPQVVRYLSAAGSMYARDIDYAAELTMICPLVK